ncbi:MAG: peptidylprolyl isomerase, partial [Phycisphaerales bacterium]|nr:peptidylprolyl isomerase [Phycisphaerales bacterium]
MNTWLKPLTRVGAGVASLIVAAAATLGADIEPQEGMVYVEMKTNLGEVILELNPELAPKSVENFMQYVEDEFYDGTV